MKLTPLLGGFHGGEGVGLLKTFGTGRPGGVAQPVNAGQVDSICVMVDAIANVLNDEGASGRLIHSIAAVVRG